MKQKYYPVPFHSHQTQNLFDEIYSYLDSDLTDPDIQESARSTLEKLRKEGLDFLSFDREEPDCLSCLYLALESAAELAHEPTLNIHDDLCH